MPRSLAHLAIFAILAVSASVDARAEATKVTDQASAIEAAKRYTKAKCTEKPCTYKARREGKQWNVLVQYRGGGHVLLYFDGEGALVRRVEGE